MVTHDFKHLTERSFVKRLADVPVELIAEDRQVVNDCLQELRVASSHFA